jgi:hypothetical protein
LSVLQDLPAEAGDGGIGTVNVLVPGYEGLTVAKVLPRLAALSRPQLQRLADYERRHMNRKPVLDAIERLLG